MIPPPRQGSPHWLPAVTDTPLQGTSLAAGGHRHAAKWHGGRNASDLVFLTIRESSSIRPPGFLLSLGLEMMAPFFPLRT